MYLVGKQNPTTKLKLQRAKIGDMFPVVDREDAEAAWRRVVVKKVRKNTWQLIDEFGEDNICVIEATVDTGSIAEWDMYYRAPQVLHVHNAKKAMAKYKRESKGKDLRESPRRAEMRDEAVVHMKKGGRAMKEKATKVGGEVKKGTVVLVPMADVDTTKVDGKNLVCVVVDVFQPRSGSGSKMYKLACTKGAIKRLYNQAYFNVEKNATVESMGLADIYESESWRAMPEIAERTAYALESMVGGQGKRKKTDKGYCNCKKGKCASQKCVCKVAGRVCSSRCHGGLDNPKCTNHDDC